MNIYTSFPFARRYSPNLKKVFSQPTSASVESEPCAGDAPKRHISLIATLLTVYCKLAADAVPRAPQLSQIRYLFDLQAFCVSFSLLLSSWSTATCFRCHTNGPLFSGSRSPLRWYRYCLSSACSRNEIPCLN